MVVIRFCIFLLLEVVCLFLRFCSGFLAFIKLKSQERPCLLNCLGSC